MKLGMQVDLDPDDHIVLDGDPFPSPPKGGGGRSPPIFGPYLLWPHGCMPLDMEEGLGPGDFVLDGDPAPSSPKFSAHVHCGQTAR